MEWYYTQQNQQRGPVDETELRRLIQIGDVAPTDLVWHSGMGDHWARVASVPELFPSPPADGTPPPPPAWTPLAASAHGIGATHNRDFMRMARDSLRTHWGLGVGVTALYWVLLSGIGSLIPCVGALACIVISGPMALGLCIVFLTLARGAKAEVGQLFAGFKSFGTSLAAYLLTLLFILLWTLLLIIPGIVACYSYSMTYFIIADDPAIKPLDAIARSKAMMRGAKWKLFCLDWRFFGWLLLCLLTCGIGFLWLAPYMQTARAHFYEDIRPRR